MRITKEVEVDSAHKHLHHPGKCGNLHGHRWTFRVSVEGPVSEEDGMVVDFGHVKDAVMEYDHLVLINEEDPVADALEDEEQPVKRLPYDPTAENLARTLHRELLDRIGEGYEVEVEVWETPHNRARYPPEW